VVLIGLTHQLLRSCTNDRRGIILQVANTAPPDLHHAKIQTQEGSTATSQTFQAFQLFSPTVCWYRFSIRIPHEFMGLCCRYMEFSKTLNAHPSSSSQNRRQTTWRPSRSVSKFLKKLLCVFLSLYLRNCVDKKILLAVLGALSSFPRAFFKATYPLGTQEWHFLAGKVEFSAFFRHPR
jgi:hypothetical protein